MVYCGKPSKGCSNCRERKIRVGLLRLQPPPSPLLFNPWSFPPLHFTLGASSSSMQASVAFLYAYLRFFSSSRL